MSKELIERLRNYPMLHLCEEAADRIEELERLLAERDEKIATLDAEVRAEQIWVKYWHSQVALLREALEEAMYCNSTDVAKQKAEAALAATEEKK